MNEPIGVFDSGIGGLAVIKKILDYFPHKDVVYFGDTARMPYGNKDPELIFSYTKQNIDFLRSKNVETVVAACGTASTVMLKKKYDYGIPVFGIVIPLCKSAVKITKNKRIAVVATETAIISNEYKRTIQNISKDIEIFQQECPTLATMIENNTSYDSLIEILNVCLLPLIKKNIDVLILGCTHYSIIKNIINDIFKDIVIVDPAQEMADFLKGEFCQEKIIDKKGRLDIFVSKLSGNFVENVKLFFGETVAQNIKVIDYIP
ncbi:MAG: glutamate racemase [Candidatus Improbicoccus pseudotrichonymphae]|uniref:Glutamate racemase n=1 Tax=Candidatus Improbicoccus pseudotrichonymphae TaxID=3033792 RepID=A0AA48HV38_9FIRM|nr:MAG: glutamate racemase [Candidatus Improbicoccus pseudotrichonymphae]